MEIKEVRDGQVIEPTTPAQIPNVASNPTQLPDGFLDRMAVSQVMGLETDSDRSKYESEMDNIIKWAKMEGYENPSQLKWIINRLQDRLGTPPLTEKWITRVGRYAALALQEKQIKDEQDSLMRGFNWQV